MSDTDDTDSLLSVATPSGLTNFLGLTVEQMSTHINSLTTNPPASGNGKEVTQGDVSREELMRQLGEWSDSDNENDDAKSETGSEASTASTNSITLIVPSDKQKDEKATENDVVEISTEQVSTSLDVEDFCAANGFCSGQTLEFKYDKFKSPNYGVRISPGFGAQGLDFLRPAPDSGWRYMPGSEADPQITSRAPNFRTPGGYKPRENPSQPRDLTDAQIQEEVRQMYAFPDITEDKTVGATEPPRTIEQEKAGLKGEGDGEYTPSSEIGTESIQSISKIKGEIILNAQSDSGPDDKIQTENGEPPAAVPKETKKKVFSVGDSAGSVPDLGFGLRDFDKLEVRETPVVPSQAWITGSEQKKKSKKKDRPSVSFAQFRDDNQMEISPIKAAYLEKNCTNPDISRCLPRYRPSRGSRVSSPRKVNLLELDLLWRGIRATKERMEEDILRSSEQLKALSINNAIEDGSGHAEEESTVKLFEQGEKEEEKARSLQLTRNPSESSVKFKPRPFQDTPSSSVQEQNEFKAPSRHKARVRTSPEASSKATDVSFDFSATSDDLPTMSFPDPSVLPTDLDTLELSSILSAAHLKTSEFEEILEKLDEAYDDPFEDIQSADEEIDGILTNLQVSDWAKSGANEFLQKYHEEKFKREHCETEIAQLQKVILKMQEDSAVNEKLLAKKDAVLIKMTKAWGEMTQQWKAHEIQSKEILDKLQKRQNILTECLQQSKNRIEEYEKELANAVELAATFKSKMDALEALKCEEVEKLREENNALKENFSGLQDTLESIKTEKDAAVRALSESQKQLDERILLHTEMQEKLSLLEVEAEESQKGLLKVTEQKNALEDHLQTVTVQKGSLEGQVTQLAGQLEVEIQEKERLRSSVQLEIERQVKEETDRLHRYYNDKLQEALQLQTQRMVTAETQIIEDHQKQLTHLEREMLRKIRDVKNRYLNESSKMKSRYEKEVKALREELSQKQQFISTISLQLQSFVQSGHEARPYKTIPGQIFGEGSSLSLSGNGKNNSEVSISSSTESTVEETIAKIRSTCPSSRAVVGLAEENTSGEEVYPSKLSRYNTSTPNSAVCPPSMKNIKGWRELPDIQHLLQPLSEKPMSSNFKSLDEETKVTKKPSFPTTSSQVGDNYGDSHLKSSEELVGHKPSVHSYLHSLVKSYSLRPLSSSCTQDSDEHNVREQNKISEPPFVNNKVLKDNANSFINSGRESSKGVSAAGLSHRVSIPAADTTTTTTGSQRRNSQKPPWK